MVLCTSKSNSYCKTADWPEVFMYRVTCGLPHCVHAPLIVWKTFSARCDGMSFLMKGLISEFKVKVCGLSLGFFQTRNCRSFIRTPNQSVNQVNLHAVRKLNRPKNSSDWLIPHDHRWGHCLQPMSEQLTCVHIDLWPRCSSASPPPSLLHPVSHISSFSPPSPEASFLSQETAWWRKQEVLQRGEDESRLEPEHQMDFHKLFSEVLIPVAASEVLVEEPAGTDTVRGRFLFHSGSNSETRLIRLDVQICCF